MPESKSTRKSAAKNSEGQVTVQNVNHPGTERKADGVKYRAMREAVGAVLPDAAPGLTYAEMSAAIRRHLPEEVFPGGKTAGWWLKTVQLDLEAKRLITREPTKPLRWHSIAPQHASDAHHAWCVCVPVRHNCPMQVCNRSTAGGCGG